MPGILIVEDDKELREMLKMALLRRNFTSSKLKMARQQ